MYNGSEFIIRELKNSCDERRVTFTRSRSGNKSDDAHVEQKTWSRVREQVGYLRYDIPAESELLNEVWELDRIFAAYLLPQQKLVEKTLAGAKATQVHDKPATPHKCEISHPRVKKMPAIRMNATFKRIRVMALSRQIMVLTGRLETLSAANGGTATNHLTQTRS
ncbi:hypothetical protein JOF47_004290 [Paeniglutamicibacter kerguelensis]|uniref:Transposase n=1 Tax=Paeniglutamicibacter kerguelensis TaxID=254788 RepID=A0ABS4XJS8_9MICC|nr:hypothetical protein [Paeniglutamicibacter kerguelensis]